VFLREINQHWVMIEGIIYHSERPARQVLFMMLENCDMPSVSRMQSLGAVDANDV
jgi:hypothetical protein